MISHTLRKFAFIIVIIYSSAVVVGVSSKDEFETIFLRVYNGTTINEHIDYSLKNNVSEIMSGIDNSEPTMMYIHGYTENLGRTSVHMVMNAYLERRKTKSYKVNIMAVDYSKLVDDTYIDAMNNAPRVGKILAKVLDEMKELDFDTEKLHIVGHSLGGQVAGYVARKVNFRVPRITGLDPAGPGYNFLLPDLSSSDADFVDVIHTDCGAYGIAKSVGTVDFFPNCGKRVQPGCPKVFPFTDGDYCSHHRSWKFYAESVINESAFVGVECCVSMFCNKCNNNTEIMGFATPSSANGTFYLVTNSQSPFGLGEQGAKFNSTNCIIL